MEILKLKIFKKVRMMLKMKLKIFFSFSFKLSKRTLSETRPKLRVTILQKYKRNFPVY